MDPQISAACFGVGLGGSGNGGSMGAIEVCLLGGVAHRDGFPQVGLVL